MKHKPLKYDAGKASPHRSPAPRELLCGTCPLPRCSRRWREQRPKHPELALGTEIPKSQSSSGNLSMNFVLVEMTTMLLRSRKRRKSAAADSSRWLTMRRKSLMRRSRKMKMEILMMMTRRFLFLSFLVCGKSHHLLHFPTLLLPAAALVV